jgi:hypothetical protein
MRLFSFTLVLLSYDSAQSWLRRFNDGTVLLSDEEKHHLLVETQKMIVLDYIIRNTDRHEGNWMIKCGSRVCVDK